MGQRRDVRYVLIIHAFVRHHLVVVVAVAKVGRRGGVSADSADHAGALHLSGGVAA